jgi:hypothetical protein
MTSSWQDSGDCGGVCGNDGHAYHLIKAWPTTTHAGSSAFTNNVGAKAHAPSCRSVPELLRDIDGLMCCRLWLVHVSGHVVSHLGRCRAGPRSTREDTHTVRSCHRRRIANPNLVSLWVAPDVSFRMGRAMERVQPTRRSSQTVSDNDHMGTSDLVFLFFKIILSF